MKTSIFSGDDYARENRKTRPKPKKDKHVIKVGKVDKRCRLCDESATNFIKEGLEVFNLCKYHFEQHERKKMNFKKPYFEKASEID